MCLLLKLNRITVEYSALLKNGVTVVDDLVTGQFRGESTVAPRQRNIYSCKFYVLIWGRQWSAIIGRPERTGQGWVSCCGSLSLLLSIFLLHFCGVVAREIGERVRSEPRVNFVVFAIFFIIGSIAPLPLPPVFTVVIVLRTKQICSPRFWNCYYRFVFCVSFFMSAYIMQQRFLSQLLEQHSY